MKKVSIIAVALIFVLSVVAVGFLGMALRVYNPIDYVTEIEWINSTQVLNTLAASIPGVGSYDKDLDNDDNIDYPLKHRSGNPEIYGANNVILASGCDLAGNKKLNLNFKCVAVPHSASNTELKYFVSDGYGKYTFSEGDNNSFNVVIEEPCNVNIRISSLDGSNIVYLISLIIE